MGATLQRVFAPLQGGGFLTANHGLFFVYYLQLLFSLLNNPLFAPSHYSGAQEPFCQPIDALPSPLLQEPVSLLTIYPGSYCIFCQGKPGQGMQ